MKLKLDDIQNIEIEVAGRLITLRVTTDDQGILIEQVVDTPEQFKFVGQIDWAEALTFEVETELGTKQ